MVLAQQDGIKLFRSSLPYINAHQGKTFVLMFGGEAIEHPNFPNIIQDIALLNSLGVRVVVVHGARPQIDQRVALRSIEGRFENGVRITDKQTLECVKDAAGSVRSQVEALLTMGLPNSPMHGAQIRVCSGNLVVAKPMGVRGGIDFENTGLVRRIDTTGINDHLNDGSIVLLSPMGYSSTGEVFNLSHEDVATQAAIALKADKLIVFSNYDGVYNREELGINNLAILPYDGRLRMLPNYLQQLDMESNGKQSTADNKAIDYPTGPIIWGGFGPNGQHAFFQHLHQGYDQFTADFVTVLKREAPGFSEATRSGLAEQQRLAVANCLAHRRLMWDGSENAGSPSDHYPGRHPSNLLIMDELTPESFGALIAAYEHKVFTQGVIWGLNSFDQPGVEKGKKIAMDVLRVLDGESDESFDQSTDAIIQRMR